MFRREIDRRIVRIGGLVDDFLQLLLGFGLPHLGLRAENYRKMPALLGSVKLENVYVIVTHPLLGLLARLFNPATLPSTAAEIGPNGYRRLVQWHHVVMNSSMSCGRNRS